MKTNQANKPNFLGHFTHLIGCMGLALLVATFAAQPAYAAKHAAKVIYSFGDVQAQGKKGARGLKKGDLVYSGESVATTRGRAQIKFTDGGFASLQPNTEYQIDDYKFEGKADGKERSFLSLLKGSVRLVTGVIGKANRRNFRIKTSVATIGIRGTQGTLTHDPITNITSLRGHGGEWDLESGSFSGGVPQGQAYSCDGVSCAKIAGLRERSDVGNGRGRASRRRGGYQQGQQTAPDGRICDLGGACDELLVELDQVGAVAGTLDDGEVMSGGTDFLEGLGAVTVGGKPVAFVADTVTDGDDGIAIVATDINAVRSAIEQVGNQIETEEGADSSDFAAEANAVLDEIDPGLLADLEANPASVAEEDFGTTPDGLVTFGRWVNGNVLIYSKNLGTGQVTDERLDLLENFESFHFIYGDMLEDISFMGTGIYSLTGATYPTAIDGSSMGEMPISGALTWNFGSATGDLVLPVVFDNMLFTITGTLQAPDPSDLLNPSVPAIFTENSVSALYVGGGMMQSYAVTLDGFFTGENGSNAPLAAGLAYEVDYYMNPFVGTAAFGLASQSAFVSEATIKYALIYFDSTGMVPGSLSNGDDQFPMGTPLSNFTTTFGDSFNLAGGTNVESGSDAATSAHWARFTAGYTFTSGALVSGELLTEDFHAIKTDYTTPNDVIASTTGMATYNYAGGTSPTIVYDIGSLTYIQSTGNTMVAQFVADFTAGTMTSIAIQGNFPTVASGNFALSSTGPVPVNLGTAALVGTFNDSGAVNTAGCMGGCALSGLVNYGFTSQFAGGPPAGVISSFNASGSGINLFHIAGTAFSN